MTQMMTFIGGPADGKTYEVRDGVEVVYVDERPPAVRMSNMNQQPPTKEAVFAKHTYRRDGNVMRHQQ